jgi:hypothetical protein
LPLQASAVACERVFSSAKETDTDRRSTIGVALFEALQVLKFALKKDESMNFTDWLSQVKEDAEFDERSRVESLVSGDVQDFMKDLMVEVPFAD